MDDNANANGDTDNSEKLPNSSQQNPFTVPYEDVVLSTEPVKPISPKPSYSIRFVFLTIVFVAFSSAIAYGLFNEQQKAGRYIVKKTDTNKKTITNVSDTDAEINEPDETSVDDSALALSVRHRITIGASHVCALNADDELYCWGKNWAGQLGNGYTGYSITRGVVDVSNLNDEKIVDLGSGNSFSCLLTDAGKVYCWGDNGSGEVGDGSNTLESRTANYVTRPTAIKTDGELGGKKIIGLHVGYATACGLAADSTVYCWGYGQNGDIGNGADVNSSVPKAVDLSKDLFGKKIETISNGGSACVITSDKALYCWGSNRSGQLGGDFSGQYSNLPISLSSSGGLAGKNITMINGGNFDNCAITSEKQTICWGGGSSQSRTPSPVSIGTQDVVMVTSGAGHTCALSADSKVFCWGFNITGELGNNSKTESKTPVQVDDTGVLQGKTITTIATGARTSCAMDDQNRIYCWGDNDSGQLGSLTDDYSSTPVEVSLPD